MAWTISEASGFPLSVDVVPAGIATQTLAITVISVGDLLLCAGRILASTTTVTKVSGGGVTTWNKGLDFVDATNSRYVYLWYGRTTATGAQTVTVTFSASLSAQTGYFVDELSVGQVVEWYVTSVSLAAGGASTTAALYPSATSSGNPTQGYWGFGRGSTATSAGNTSGFTYTGVGGTNVPGTVCFDGALAPDTVYQPNFTLATAGNYDSVALATFTTSSLNGVVAGPPGVA